MTGKATASMEQKSATCVLAATRFKQFWRLSMDGIIYIVGLIVVVMAVLSLLGLR